MKKINRLISLLLVGATLFNNFAPLVSALEDNDSNKQGEVALNDVNDKVDIDVKGDIEIETKFVLPIRNSGANDVTIKIYDGDNKTASVSMNEIRKTGYYVDKTVKLVTRDIRLTANMRDKDASLLTGVDKNNDIAYIAVNLYGLAKGTYKVELSGKNFVTCTTDVTLDDFSKRVEITNEKGMFEIGDVDSSLKVDENDAKLVLDAIRNKDTKYDLNLDGIIDIADLNYITAIINGEKKGVVIEKTNAIIDNSKVELDVAEDTSVVGSLNSIFNDEGSITLKRNDSEKVSEENPISLTMNLGNSETETIPVSEIVISAGDNAPKKLTAIVLDDKGREHKIEWQKGETNVSNFTDKSKGEIVIDLQGQVAVKKVTIVITETASTNLADIAKVEFLNNVKVETKAPADLDIPKNIKVDTSVSEQLTVSFQSVPNVTGYEIRIYGKDKEGNDKNTPGVIFETTFTTFTIEDLKNYKTYKIWVRAVNQEWKSNWSTEVEATPEAKRLPPPVDMVTLTPIYSGLEIGWKDMDDTESYNIYYREVTEKEYTSIKNQTGTKYTLKGLKDGVEYQVYITGNNKLGEGSQSQIVKAKTLKADATIVPKYKLINTELNGEEKNNHIKDVLYSDGTMTDNNKFSIVDDKFNTIWEKNAWHAGTYYSENSQVPIIVLDKEYKMDEFVITVPDSYKYFYKTSPANDGDIMLRYWQDKTEKFDNSKRISVKATLKALKDENGRLYYLMKLDEPITANAVQFGLTVKDNAPSAQISEIKLYEYDSLVDDVNALFTDDLRLVLSDGVTQEKIDELRKRADIKDNGEYNPYRETILADLVYAEKILNDEDIKDVITLNPNISNEYNKNAGFAMSINDFQPLGIVAKPKDKLTIYVGSKGNVNAEVVFTQYYAEANAWKTTYRPLQKGQNIIEVPQIGTSEAERGGSVYIRYTSTPDAKNPIRVRVSGGTKIPVLDITTLTSENDKKEAIKTYINELDSYVKELKNNKDYVARESILDSTEIATRQGLLSVSAVAVKDAIDTNLTTLDAKINRLYKSTLAFDEMIDFFYRQKGFEANPENVKDKLPQSRINIRYMRMFDGAFMYAGGEHIGIGYGSIAGLVQADVNSELKTGYFGWGISHEVGHQINQGTLAIAEVTNNIYSLLAQTSNDNDKSRLEISGIYPKIYEKVTSGTKGKAQNVFVQLGMYWQLHLAYDDKNTFEDTNSIFARINKLARSYDNKETNYSKDDLLVLFASKAANRDLTEFFEAWGLRPTTELKTYLKDELELPKETRQIRYLNDEARRYRMKNPNGGFTSDIKLEANLAMTDNAKKEITLKFNLNKETDALLGYEIIRNGESIAFVEASENSYVDRIGAENNRAYVYQVVAYDKLLNKTETVTLEETKISYDGSLSSKDTFSIESNFKESGEIVDLEDSDMDYAKLSVNKLIDGDTLTSFNGDTRIKTFVPGTTANVTTDNNNAYIIISLNDLYAVTGVKYRAALDSNGNLSANTITKYKIYVSEDKEKWDLVKSGTFNITKDNPEDLVYFMKPGTDSENQLWTYDNIAYIKIESDGNKNGISGSEVDIIAPPGDNVDISYTSSNMPTIGKLKEDYTYDASLGEDGIIKAGSVVIKGEYRGSPSFNVLTITDSKDSKKVYSGYQLLFANINSDMSVYEVANGIWVYVMTQEEYQKLLNESSSIRVNLYRVNDALTNDGQRLTSTSKSITNLPSYDELKPMSINSSSLED